MLPSCPALVARCGRAYVDLPSAPLQIEVFSDVVCPWCWLGKRRLERAREQLDFADDVAALDDSAPPCSRTKLVRERSDAWCTPIVQRVASPAEQLRRDPRS